MPYFATCAVYSYALFPPPPPSQHCARWLGIWYGRVMWAHSTETELGLGRSGEIGEGSLEEVMSAPISKKLGRQRGRVCGWRSRWTASGQRQKGKEFEQEFGNKSNWRVILVACWSTKLLSEEVPEQSYWVLFPGQASPISERDCGQEVGKTKSLRTLCYSHPPWPLQFCTLYPGTHSHPRVNTWTWGLAWKSPENTELNSTCQFTPTQHSLWTHVSFLRIEGRREATLPNWRHDFSWCPPESLEIDAECKFSGSGEYLAFRREPQVDYSWHYYRFTACPTTEIFSFPQGNHEWQFSSVLQPSCLMTETDPLQVRGARMDGPRCHDCGVHLAADPRSPPLTKDSTQNLACIRSGGKKHHRLTALLLLPRLKSSWDKGYFWQFVFKYAMLQSQLSKCKLRCGCPS